MDENATPSMIENFKQRARDFWGQWETLNNNKEIANKSPAIRKEYDDLLSRGSTIRNSVETVTGLIDKASNAYNSAKGWVTDIFGLNGNENELGFLPVLIPVAVIGGSLAAMGKWLKDVYEFNRKMEEIHRLEARGIDSVTASKIVERVSPEGSSLFGDAKKILILSALLGGGFLAYKAFKGK